MTKDNMAQEIGLSKQSILSIIDKMVERGFIEKDGNTKHLKTTQLWYKEFVIYDGKENGPAVNFLYPDGKLSLPDGGELSLPNNNTIDNKKDKEDISPIGDIQQSGLFPGQVFKTPEKEKNFLEVNKLIGEIKKEACLLKIAYDKKNDRNFAKHILTAKEYGEFAESLSLTREELALEVMRASIKTSFRKGICAGPMTIYQNYSEVYNKTYQTAMKQTGGVARL